MAKKKENEKSYEGCYGKVCRPSQIVEWIKRKCEDNFKTQEKGERWTGNIWGHPGIGKTAIAKQMKSIPVTYKGKEYKGYSVVDVPLAQIEEMGDILGCPDDFITMVNGNNEEKSVLAKDSVINYYISLGYKIKEGSRVETKYAPPSWVPTEEKPGIIIFDDGNRASIRIQKGIMQLVQDYKTIGWEIPKGWTIIFTGNPDNQNYLVTTVDDAIITRQSHITMEPNAQEWAVWATDQKIDKRGISFLLKCPEMMVGNRTNPRTLTQFFRCLDRYPNLEAEKENVMIDGKSYIDDEILTAFMVFVTRDMKMVIEPEDVLDRVEKVFPEIDKLMNGKEPRVDIMGVTCDRLYAHLLQSDYKIKDKHVENFQKFVVYPQIPEDMRHSLMRRLAEANDDKNKLSEFLLNNKEILRIVAKSIRVQR